ncbi:hypothetical protein HPP92_020904 [Vanilla planifolia]|uniref:Uncharacterized protein n=1 Tax=Vanilla planifolia TaxID=51239 RepID=A0A835UIA2_VANPL|nr:hypothetical protein HPP92_020904 [Vanilla planifolia]
MEGSEARKEKQELFHVIHKVPFGDSPYVRAKHLQLVAKDLEASIPWFWKAINNGDRIDSALKDMALVMKQKNRAEDAIEAIKSFRHLCSKHAQESLDNVLIDLYKKCGRVEEQIALLKKKLKLIYSGEAFNGKSTKTARSHGRKFQVSIAQEISRVLQGNYKASEAVYLKAQMIDADANKACNLGLCLIKQGRFGEARHVLHDVLSGRFRASRDGKVMQRAAELLQETETALLHIGGQKTSKSLEEEAIERISLLLNEWAPLESIFDRSPVFEDIGRLRDEVAS